MMQGCKAARLMPVSGFILLAVKTASARVLADVAYTKLIKRKRAI